MKSTTAKNTPALVATPMRSPPLPVLHGRKRPPAARTSAPRLTHGRDGEVRLAVIGRSGSSGGWLIGAPVSAAAPQQSLLNCCPGGPPASSPDVRPGFTGSQRGQPGRASSATRARDPEASRPGIAGSRVPERVRPEAARTGIAEDRPTRNCPIPNCPDRHPGRCFRCSRWFRWGLGRVPEFPEPPTFPEFPVEPVPPVDPPRTGPGPPPSLGDRLLGREGRDGSHRAGRRSYPRNDAPATTPRATRPPAHMTPAPPGGREPPTDQSWAASVRLQTEPVRAANPHRYSPTPTSSARPRVGTAMMSTIS